MANIDKIIAEQLVHRTIIEATELAKILEEEYDIKPARKAVLKALLPEIFNEFETDNFVIELKTVGPKKIAVIKELRRFLNFGLKEAKEVVDSAPTIIIKEFSKTNAENFKSNLENLGCTIEIESVFNLKEEIKLSLGDIVNDQIENSMKGLDELSSEIKSIRSSINRINSLIEDI